MGKMPEAQNFLIPPRMYYFCHICVFQYFDFINGQRNKSSRFLNLDVFTGYKFRAYLLLSYEFEKYHHVCGHTCISSKFLNSIYREEFTLIIVFARKFSSLVSLRLFLKPYL